MIFDAFDKLVPRLSIFCAFLVSPENLPEDWLKTLRQKQYLVGEVEENCLIQV